MATKPKAAERHVYIIQVPSTFEAGKFNMDAVAEIGPHSYVLPASPNIYDPDRVNGDLQRLRDAVRGASDEDVFLCLGGAPLSNMLFGAAVALERKTINMGLYSRKRDNDGRRDVGGEYRIVPLTLEGD